MLTKLNRQCSGQQLCHSHFKSERNPRGNAGAHHSLFNACLCHTILTSHKTQRCLLRSSILYATGIPLFSTLSANNEPLSAHSIPCRQIINILSANNVPFLISRGLAGRQEPRAGRRDGGSGRSSERRGGGREGGARKGK